MYHHKQHIICQDTADGVRVCYYRAPGLFVVPPSWQHSSKQQRRRSYNVMQVHVNPTPMIRKNIHANQCLCIANEFRHIMPRCQEVSLISFAPRCTYPGDANEPHVHDVVLAQAGQLQQWQPHESRHSRIARHSTPRHWHEVDDLFILLCLQKHSRGTVRSQRRRLWKYRTTFPQKELREGGHSVNNE